MPDDEEERDLVAEVDSTRARAEEEGPDARVRALFQLGAYYLERERTREAALTLRAAREAARAEVGESRSAPRTQAALLLEIGAVELALGERRLAERVLREAERIGVLVAREGDRLRLRFEDGERVLLADRVTRCDWDEA